MKFRSKNLLVTGGAGFIGSNLVDKLLSLGHEVTVVDNEFSTCHDQFYWNPQANNIKGDIRDYELMKNAFSNVDYCFHLAAEARIQPAIKNPIEAVSINSVGTCTILNRHINICLFRLKTDDWYKFLQNHVDLCLKIKS